jgi:hypothetical protein
MLIPIHTCDADLSQVQRSKDRPKGVPFNWKNKQSLPVKGSEPGNAIVHGGATKT